MVVKIVRVLNRLGVVNNGHFKVLVTECLVPSLLETQCLWFLLGFFNFFLEKLLQHVHSRRTVTPGIHDSERSLSVVITVVEHAFEFGTHVLYDVVYAIFAGDMEEGISKFSWPRAWICTFLQEEFDDIKSWVVTLNVQHCWRVAFQIEISWQFWILFSLTLEHLPERFEIEFARVHLRYQELYHFIVSWLTCDSECIRDVIKVRAGKVKQNPNLIDVTSILKQESCHLWAAVSRSMQERWQGICSASFDGMLALNWEFDKISDIEFAIFD